MNDNIDASDAPLQAQDAPRHATSTTRRVTLDIDFGDHPSYGFGKIVDGAFALDDNEALAQKVADHLNQGASYQVRNVVVSGEVAAPPEVVPVVPLEQ